MASWADLEDELAAWQVAGQTPTFWWRNDDANAPSLELEPLLSLSNRHGIPAHLAVVPESISPALAPRLAACRDVHVLQHGFAHINHEPKGLGASEIGPSRALALQLADLREGWQRLVSADLPNVVPCLVPPWNRIADKTLAELPQLGYRFISAFEGPTSTMHVKGLMQVHAHVDPMRWKQGGRFRGAEATLDLFLKHLCARRRGDVPVDEPTAFLTHHLQTGDDIWVFVDELFNRMTRQGIARWIRLASLDQSG